MTSIPTHVASWTSGTDDLAANDRSRFRGEDTPENAVTEDLGNGLVSISYVDCPCIRDQPEACPANCP